MNFGKALASIGPPYAGLCKRGRPGRCNCGDHGVKSISIAFNAAGRFLETTSRDTSCCTCQMLVTECVTSQPMPVTHGCKSLLTLAPGRRVLLSTNLVVACLIVHGSIG